MTRLFFIIVLVVFVSCRQKNSTEAHTNNSTDTLFFQTYGFDIDPKNIIRDDIAAKYNFYFKAVAGCMVTDSLIDAVNFHNAKVDSVLQIKFGADWKKKFYSEIDNMYTVDTVCLNLIGAQLFINNYEKFQRQDGAEKGTTYLLNKTIPTKDTSVFEVVSYSCSYKEKLKPIRFYCRALVDYKNKKVLSVDTVNCNL